MIGRAWSMVVLALLVVVAAALPASAHENNFVEFSGGGWGHGVGLSQYGAQGQALEGRTAEEIVTHYFAGTSTADITNVVSPDSFLFAYERPLWVGLLNDRFDFRFRPVGGDVELCQAGDGEGACPKSAVPADGQMWTFTTNDEGGCQFEFDGAMQGNRGACSASITWTEGTYIELPDATISGLPLRVSMGTIKVRPWGEGFHVSLATTMEEYLRGIAEVPTDWHPEAMKTQAIAARSYAAAKALQRETGTRSGSLADPALSSTWQNICWCHIRRTTSDQFWIGWAREQNETWRAAVEATAGIVLTHPDTDFTVDGVVETFYSSSTIGTTESNRDGFGSSVQYPYLVPVDDPWSADPDLNPNASWVKHVDAATIISKLKATSRPWRIDFHQLFNAVLLQAAPGTTVRFSGMTAGGERSVDVPGWWMRSAFGLKSPQLSSLRSVLPSPLPTPGQWTEQVSGDFNGDGLADLAGYSESSGRWFVSTSSGTAFDTALWAELARTTGWETWVVGDFNRDGRDDLAGYHGDDGTWWVGLADGTTFAFSVWADFYTADGWTDRLVGDFNGDGRADIANYHPRVGRWYVSISTGTRFSTKRWAEFERISGWQEFVVGDFDGDGRDDLAGFHPDDGTWWVGLAADTGLTSAVWADFHTTSGWDARVVGDYNGDGRDDVASYHRRTGRWFVSTSLGDSFGTSLWAQVDRTTGWKNWLGGDFNGDGLPDLAGFHPSDGTWWVGSNTGSGFDVWMWADFVSTSGWTTQLATDFDGDGLDDVANYHAPTGRWYVSRSRLVRFVSSLWADF